VRGDPDSTEARIAQVEPNQPADRAGIKVGDVIVRFDGQEVKTFSDLVGMVAEREPGEKVKIVVRRGEELIELELVIGRRR
jgi:serine protease Do